MGINHQPSNIQSPGIIRHTIYFNILSPVHIGTKDGFLKVIEFLHHNGKTYLIDENKTAEFFLDKGLIDKFVEAAEEGYLYKGMYGFLINNMPKEEAKEAIKKISLYSIPGGEAQMQEFRPFIRDGKNNPYIPGSSIKGAIRTAVLLSILDTNPTLLQRKQDWVNNNIQNKNKKYFSQYSLQQELLQSFRLPSQRATSQNKDIFRCLKVSDAYPVDEIETRIIPVKILAKDQRDFYWSKKNKPKKIWVEAVCKGIFECSITWDTRLFEIFKKQNNNLPISGFEDILKCMKTLTSKIKDFETWFYQQQKNAGALSQVLSSLHTFYENLDENAFRIGYGPGMLGTTVDILFDENTRKRIRNKFGTDRGDDIAPKSRRVCQLQNNFLPLGWIIISKDLSEAQSKLQLPQQGKTTGSKMPEAEIEIWQDVYLSYTPGNGIIHIKCIDDESKKAETKNKELVPEEMHNKLFKKRKTIKASKVEVKKLASKIEIIKIEK